MRICRKLTYSRRAPTNGTNFPHGRRQTRWQTLYRSDCTDELDQVGQQRLLDAGLRTVIDLRDSSDTIGWSM